MHRDFVFSLPQVIPQALVHEYQLLVRECEYSQHHSSDPNSSSLVSHLDAMLGVVEEGIQLLSASVHTAEHSILLGMRRDLSRHLRVLVYGFNNCKFLLWQFLAILSSILVMLEGLKFCSTSIQ